MNVYGTTSIATTSYLTSSRLNPFISFALLFISLSPISFLSVSLRWSRILPGKRYNSFPPSSFLSSIKAPRSTYQTPPPPLPCNPVVHTCTPPPLARTPLLLRKKVVTKCSFANILMFWLAHITHGIISVLRSPNGMKIMHGKTRTISMHIHDMFHAIIYS